MRIVAITRILDEIDIVESFVRHSASFVDHHIFMDNGSEDGTLAVLLALQQEGLPITVFQNRCVSFNEANHLTFLFREAIRAPSADWVICLDADEFIDDRGEPDGLRGRMAAAQANPQTIGIRLPMVFYAATREDDAAQRIVPLRMRKRREPTNNCKVIARGNPDFQISEGGHAIRHAAHAGYVEYQTRIRLAHYAERSPAQYILKFVRGWLKVLAAGDAVVKTGVANHYKGAFDLLMADQALFLKSDSLAFKNDVPTLTFDPIAYRGGALRHTPDVDDAMHTARGMMRVMRDLALRHGALVEAVPEAQQRVTLWDSECVKLF